MQYSFILLLVTFLPWSCIDDYMVNQCKETTLILLAYSIDTFTSFAIFIQGSLWYGHFDFGNSITLVKVHWNLYAGDTLGTEARVPQIEVPPE